MYQRPLAFDRLFARGSRVFRMKTDLHNRRVTLEFGKFGQAARTVVKTFATKDEARQFDAQTVERRARLGYSQVA